jgi:hypothetical protein
MVMPRPAGLNAIVELGDNALLFPSQAAGPVTDCFILGHGGTPSGTKFKDYYFTVPAGCSVSFFTGGGSSNKLPGPGDPVGGFRAIAGSAGGPSQLQQRIQKHSTIVAGKPCRDYILAKAVGSHWKATPDQNHYVLIAQELANIAADPSFALKWQPHYVSIRNREAWGMSTNIWLSRLISEIRAWDNTVVDFYGANCRGYLDGAKATKYIKSAGSQVGAANV